MGARGPLDFTCCLERASPSAGFSLPVALVVNIAKMLRDACNGPSRLIVEEQALQGTQGLYSLISM